MKVSLVLIPVVLALFGCGSKETTAKNNAPAPAPTYEADQAVFTEASRNLVNQFSRSLKSELMAALNEGGAARALRVCRVKAPEIAAAHTKGGWSIKRVSDRMRNPDDRPIGDEGEILASFSDPDFKQDYYQDWYGSDSNKVFRYCQEIITQPMCLQCHGDLQTIEPELYKQIKIAYVWDKATGYKVGDVRGMFVVEAAWPEGRDVAQLLASGVDIESLDSALTDTADIPWDTTEDTTPAEDTIGDGNG